MPVLHNRLYAGPEIDIWSCGVILYVMLCGRLPFDDDHIPLLFKKINGGIYSLPPFLSQEARYLLSKMLIVDSNKRIKISEIRGLPWFTESLPPYLFTQFLPGSSGRPEKRSRQTSGESSGESNAGSGEGQSHVEDAGSSGFSVIDDQSEGEQIKDVGLVDDEGVAELCSKIPGLSPEDVWETLRSGRDKELRIAYMLVRDQRRGGIDPRMMMGPPPALIDNGQRDAQEGSATPMAGSSHRSASVRKPNHDKENSVQASSDEYTEDFDALAHSNIRILESSLPYNADMLAAQSSGYNALAPGRPLLRNSHHRLSPLEQKPNPLTPANVGRQPSPSAPPASSKKSKIRWHFGIRSCSEPLEVMLELYRTLKTLGFEWREKEPEKRIDMSEYGLDGSPDHFGRGGGQDEGDDPKKRKRREEEEFLKKAQALFFIETRCRIDDVQVRMDLQLYSIDAGNYLVDFRNLGYKVMKQNPEQHPDKLRYAGSRSNSTSTTTSDGTSELDSPTSPSSGPHYHHHHSSPATGGVQSLDAAALQAAGLDPTSSNPRALWETAAKHRSESSSSAATSNNQQNGSGRPDMRAVGQKQRHQVATFAARKAGGTDSLQASSPYLFLECACKLIVELGEFGHEG